MWVRKCHRTLANAGAFVKHLSSRERMDQSAVLTDIKQVLCELLARIAEWHV